MSNSENKKPDWGQPVTLNPEQIILWLEGHREFMHSVWNENPSLRKRWEESNLPETAHPKQNK